ncbi:hypothetical protein AA0114_g10094 [Alternaria tenuissima]|uniref:Uncharacterized protein n=1 Tax=Alternaria tenuissima TaxID=119927 RepID=A0A4Q4M638_9PLEO|nr:hypothetical protein AA0114_g10094 [Alternaria tenuissima]
MAAETTGTTTQCVDAPDYHSLKFEHMSRISSLAEGHVYAPRYFPGELQALLNIASLKFHEWAPGHFASVLGWPKESKQGSKPQSALSEHLEIQWGEGDRTVLLNDRSALSNTGIRPQTIISDTDEVLSRLQRGFELAPPFSTILTVVDHEHLTMLSVFFRYCLSVQSTPDSPPEHVDVAASPKAEKKPDSFCSQVESDDRAHENKTTVLEIEEIEEVASNHSFHGELETMRKEVEKYKLAYEEQSKKVEEEKSWLHKLRLAHVNSEAMLRERQKEAEE